ncbi:hypothetical protein L873DRAFT_1694449 [Choiromyces venosus 120613-1]|uniref:Core domain-containing protein n=1 Tax=Choiromyces venosus 120613-1 TaxID=1336337 RepID=A0A3N4JDU7_9PEZI|nr:hypothetical protein L873DRAFT_1694449 [Choiromyces venosus 120613-1]
MNAGLRIASKLTVRPCLSVTSRPLPITTTTATAARTLHPATLAGNVRIARLSTSTPARAAVVMNPRTDESGSLMKIDISQRAVNRLKEMQVKDSNPNLALRITVESGGCHGFKYTISLSDTFDEEEDTVFEEDGAKVVMDEPSLGLLKDSTIDYTMELIGSQFKIVNNPHATSSCGCGTSFDIKSL